VQAVPTPAPRPAFFSHPRLRRTSPITQYAVAAGLEALGTDAALVRSGSLRLGIVLCVLTGCVNYSRRFYDETLRDPAMASPLFFPETVFNAPCSHLAAVLGTTAVNYTLAGDPGTFLQGVALAAGWLLAGHADGCLVIGAEERDWLTVDGFRRFARRVLISDGAGCLYLRSVPPSARAVELIGITDSELFFDRASRQTAAARVRDQLRIGDASDLLCDGRQNISWLDAPEIRAWKDWPGSRLSPKTILGEGLMAAAAWSVSPRWMRLGRDVATVRP